VKRLRISIARVRCGGMKLPRTRSVLFALTALAALTATGGFGHPSPTWTLLTSGTDAQLRGLAVVSPHVAWASGTGGTVLRTVDSGRTWRPVSPPGASDLQFRDIEAFDADHAVVLAIGQGELSRVYTTDNGGTTWRETFHNPDAAAFYDCMAFFDRRHGLALSDPVDGKFRLLTTHDGGRSWAVQPNTGMPAALADEFAFAASGTCLVTAPGDRTDAWIASGGGAAARVFHSRDGGVHWSVSATPIPSDPAGAGIFSLAFRDRAHGIAVGGDYNAPTAAPNGSATSRDAGRTWTVSRTVPGEYRSGAAWKSGNTALAVGPSGSDITDDGGHTWTRFDTGTFDSVECAGGTCFASGAGGRIGRFSF
jgi:photosystem II stability/assembly factor-like uncharacterized protein